MKYIFDENNSGGHWRLDKADYENLMYAGWVYEATKYDIERGYDQNPFCSDPDDDVPYGWRKHLTFEAASLKIAIAVWETATDANYYEKGCRCCGKPFDIYKDDSF